MKLTTDRALLGFDESCSINVASQGVEWCMLSYASCFVAIASMSVPA